MNTTVWPTYVRTAQESNRRYRHNSVVEDMDAVGFEGNWLRGFSVGECDFGLLGLAGVVDHDELSGFGEIRTLRLHIGGVPNGPLRLLRRGPEERAVQQAGVLEGELETAEINGAAFAESMRGDARRVVAFGEYLCVRTEHIDAVDVLAEIERGVGRRIGGDEMLADCALGFRELVFAVGEAFAAIAIETENLCEFEELAGLRERAGLADANETAAFLHILREDGLDLGIAPEVSARPSRAGATGVDDDLRAGGHAFGD